MPSPRSSKNNLRDLSTRVPCPKGEVGRQTVDCLLLSFDRLPIDLGGQTAAMEGKWVYLFVTKAKAATFAAAMVNGICNTLGTNHGHNSIKKLNKT